MRWQGRRQSENVLDQRGRRMPARGVVAGGGLGTLFIVILVLLLGGDPAALMQQMEQGGGGAGGGAGVAVAQHNFPAGAPLRGV